MILKTTVKAKKIEDKLVSFLYHIGAPAEFFETHWGKRWRSLFGKTIFTAFRVHPYLSGTHFITIHQSDCVTESKKTPDRSKGNVVLIMDWPGPVET
jgi:hypothetical protein